MSEESQGCGQARASPPPGPGSESRSLTLLLAVALALACLTYAFFLFKHISYPLMWADESMTAVGAQRVLEYGYPKVHDGRNVFYDLRHSDMTLGIDRQTDAYIGGAGWGQYYFIAPFVALAESVPDLYQKTAMLRIPFALAGCVGVLLLLWTVTRSLGRRLDRLGVAILFVALLFPSVTLMLHLREVRYYSLQLLLTSVALSAFAAHHLLHRIGYRVYAAAVVCLVPLLFLTFSPASLAFCVTVCIYLGGEWGLFALRRGRESVAAALARLKPLYPVLASLALVAPLVWFFRTLTLSRKLEEFYHYSFATYLENIEVVWGYFEQFDIIVFAVAAKLLLLLLRRRLRADAALHPALKLSLLLSAYFVVHTLLIGKIPNRLFTRYFITLQPVLVLTFALDLLLLARLALGLDARRRTACAALAAALLAGSVGWAFSQNWMLLRGRWYEISHQYRGVLDFVIPYLRARYERPDKLVIATNYEETSYIYYLGSKVIVGFLNPDFRPDRLEQPDCIVYRRFWGSMTPRAVFDELLRRDAYETVRFPVLDYGFNNIPETMHWTGAWGWSRGLHLFGTVVAEKPLAQATLYIRRRD